MFQILTSLSISLINNAAADYGDAAIAGMGVVTRLVSMGSLTIFGFIKGFQPIAGYSYGAKKIQPPVWKQLKPLLSGQPYFVLFMD